jgi:two-component system, NtrC family, nitrogen regulation response regulator NtrX
MADQKHVILCVDDDPDILFVMRQILEGNGYTMIEAPSAEEGLRVFKEQTPDLIFADLMMEEVDSGTAFVKELKLLGNTCPVFMLSSVGDSLAMTADYSELGLSGVLQKPIESEKLLALAASKLS